MWLKLKKFPHYRQLNAMECGATCLKMIAKYYGKNISIKKTLILTETTREGTSMQKLSIAADKIGFRTIGLNINPDVFFQEVPLPVIIYWNSYHFVVVYKVTKNSVYISDPSSTTIKYSKKEFIENWIGKGVDKNDSKGLALLFEPTPRLFMDEEQVQKDETFKKSFKHIFSYLIVHKKFLFQLIIGIICSTILNLIFPFLTQSIVDIGIKTNNINFIYIILIAQISLYIGKISVEIIRDWILLHLSTRISISLISDFFIKLMNLPVAYFDSKLTGDILEKVNDHKRIELLLTDSPLAFILAVFNILIFGSILAYYNFTIFTIFSVGTLLYFGWIFLFFKKRKILDMKHFHLLTEEKTKIIELINGMQEIKINNAEREKRWGWEFIKARIFKVDIKKLTLEQLLNTGTSIINEIKNILIIFVAANLVISGDITLGMMLSIMYIIGQLNAPLQMMLKNTYSFQDAKIAIERLNEVHILDDEENQNRSKTDIENVNHDIILNNVSFSYPGREETILKNISLVIPSKKTTAIVGTSGSGKSTLIKLLLKFYEPKSGSINLNNSSISNISQKSWRNKCGVVMQEGYIFNDTIANNITITHHEIDKKKLLESVEIANIKEFIEKLPQSYNTKIGTDGMGLSTGEKQRLLIARAIYKEPEIIFLDEATSALDTNNEKAIVKNLNSFLDQKTVIVIAHRLSTVKNADQIVVLHNGEIAETGTHQSLINLKGKYYRLVKNQLELDS